MIDELRHVRAFLQVAQTRNFTRAASALHVSQSALTVQIQQLEDALGFLVFDRNKRGVTLTSAGQEIVLPLQRLLEDAENIMNGARGIAGLRQGSITIAALPTVSASLLPTIIRSFNQAHSSVQISVMDVVAEKVRDAVTKRHADFGIGTTVGPTEQLLAVPLFSDRLVVYATKGHDLARETTTTLKVVAKYPLILPNRDSSVRETVESIAHREHVTIRPRHETNFIATALGFVRSGIGIAILPESMMEDGSSDLVRIPFASGAFSRDIELMTRRDRTLSPAALEFVRHLRAHVDRIYPPKTGRPRKLQSR